MSMRSLKVERLGRVEYGAALDMQKRTERAVLTGEQPDTLLLLEHPHTLTLGRRSGPNGVIVREGEPVTSMQELLGREVDMESVADRIVTRFVEVFDYSESNDQTMYESAEELSIR